ncbi:hypothetical protein ACWDTI_19850 [Gordonia sp. NPDC003424]
MAAAAGIALLGLAACGTDENAVTDVPASQASTLINNSIEPAQVDQIADAVRSQGLTLTGQHDATAQLCKDAGCTDAIAFDQLTILKFPSTGRAALYNGSIDGGYQVLDLVVTFPPNTSPEVTERYQEAVHLAVR